MIFVSQNFKKLSTAIETTSKCDIKNVTVCNGALYAFMVAPEL